MSAATRATSTVTITGMGGESFFVGIRPYAKDSPETQQSAQVRAIVALDFALRHAKGVAMGDEPGETDKAIPQGPYQATCAGVTVSESEAAEVLRHAWPLCRVRYPHGPSITLAEAVHRALAGQRVDPRRMVGATGIIPSYLVSTPRQRGGRPRNRQTIPALPEPADGILLSPSGAPVILYMDAITAGGSHHLYWNIDPYGRPEFRKDDKKIAGGVTYVSEPETDILGDGLRDVWADVAALGASDLQLFMCVSNALLHHPNPTEGILISATRYAQARGISPREDTAERSAFNKSVRRLAALELNAQVQRTGGKGKVTIESIHGRMFIPEVVATVQEGFLDVPGRPFTEDVTGWRLVPGTAWLACRELKQVGRYPETLLQLNPHKDDFLIRLGAYLGHQTAIRASAGTLAQRLSIRAILDGIHEPVPEDRRRVKDLRDRFAEGMDELRDRGVLMSWEWIGDEPTPAQFTNAMITFLYHWESLDAHAEHHAATRRALATPEVKKLMPTIKRPASRSRPKPP